MFKKAPIFLWIIMLSLVAITFSCNKHDDDDDDWGGNGGGGSIWNPTIIDGKLPGLFSVSTTQQVQFSQGNLQYQASTNRWRFAEHQWDYVGSQKSSFAGEADGIPIYFEKIGGTVSGSDNSDISQTYNGWIDLFGWGTSGYNGKNPYMTSTSNIDYGDGENNIAGTNYDWGVYNTISNGGSHKNYWRTLTSEEWKYLLEMRTTPSGIRFAKAKVNDVGGLILLPDDWNANTYSLNNPNDATAESYFSDNTITATQWTTLENAGAVFLPAAGWRNETLVLPAYGFKGISDFNMPCCGYYWSISHNGNPYAARGVLFLEGGCRKCKGIAIFDRAAGLSIRLVHSAEGNNNNGSDLTVMTNEVTNITQTTAICGGTITVTGNATVTARGVCWSTTPNPTINDSHTNNGMGTGSFTSSITGLTQGTTYYVRAYATNNEGTVYGTQKTFTTTSLTIPIVITNNVTNITETTASCNGDVTSDGGSNVTSRGICWSTSQNPTINDNHFENGMGVGSFIINLTGLTHSTTYYVRAYATNSIGVGYGEQKSFNTTMPPGPTGTINGLFSVSPTQQVYFSQGNLQYQASTNTWRFAENQWDILGADNKNISSTYNGWIDLFGWGTSGYNHGAVCYQPWSTSSTDTDYYAYGQYYYNLNDQSGQADWGYNPIFNGGDMYGQWRSMTSDEWFYVVNSRQTNSGIRYAKARLNNVNGVILLPDNWNTVTYNLNNTNQYDASSNSNIINAEQWNILQNAGAVFLPASGWRSRTNVNGINSEGNYWTASYSDYNNNWGRYVFFDTDFLSTGYHSSRYCGRSVRLVRPAN